MIYLFYGAKCFEKIKENTFFVKKGKEAKERRNMKGDQSGDREPTIPTNCPVREDRTVNT